MGMQSQGYRDRQTAGHRVPPTDELSLWNLIFTHCVLESRLLIKIPDPTVVGRLKCHCLRKTSRLPFQDEPAPHLASPRKVVDTALYQTQQEHLTLAVQAHYIPDSSPTTLSTH